jgi:hypothetical protein
MQIRVLAPSDAPGFQALRLRGLQECPEAFASSYEEEVDTPLNEVERRLQAKPDSAVFGVFKGSELLSFTLNAHPFITLFCDVSRPRLSHSPTR